METIAVPLPGAGAAAAPVKKRWFRADNIRYILLFNVIAEHLLTQTGYIPGQVAPANVDASWIVTVIVCWSRMITMPGFCFISGYFSKKGDKCYQSAVFDFLVPYLIFNSLFVLCYGSSAPNIFTPTFAYWYLMCMFFWKLLTKALQQIKYIVPLSFIMALLIGAFCTDVGHFMCVSRTFGFLPFYVIGMKMSREQVAKIEKLPKIPVFIVTMAVMAVWGWMNVKNIFHIDFYYYWASYAGDSAHMDFVMWEPYGIVKGLLLRAAGYVVSFMLVFFLFVFVPDRSLPIMRDVGTRTMPPYLLHTYIIMIMRTVYTLVPALTVWYISVPIAVVLAVIVMSVLGLPVFNEWYGALINFIKKIFYQEPAKV